MSCKSREIAVGGVSTALCLTTLFMTGLVPFSSYSLPALAGFMLIPVRVEMGFSVALTVYGAAAFLAPFLVPDYEAAMIFIMFMGYYPVLYSKLQNISWKIVKVLLKLVLFNGTMIVGYWFLVSVFGLAFLVQDSTFPVGIAITFMLVTGNVILLLYDYAVGNLYKFYRIVFRKRFFGNSPRQR